MEKSKHLNSLILLTIHRNLVTEKIRHELMEMKYNKSEIQNI